MTVSTAINYLTLSDIEEVTEDEIALKYTMDIIEGVINSNSEERPKIKILPHWVL